MFELQRLVFPNNKFNCPKEMYLRYDHTKVISDTNNHKLLFSAGGSITNDTFFNAFSLEKWNKNTTINDLQLKLSGQGEFIVKVMHVNFGITPVVLAQETITLNDTFIVDIPSFSDLSLGMLFFEIQALSEGHLDYCGYLTNQQPNTNVNLGIVITHFNRKQQVNSAVKRINDELLNDPLFKDKITLTIVDNSQNSGIGETSTIQVIKNANLGGSGGFTRGLMSLIDSGKHTHCLFMDDDASCEVESIRRTYHILSYTNKDNLAVAGALLRELEPNRLFEKGAIFDGACNPLKSGLDMLNPTMCLEAEFQDQKPNYGGWWFFAFSLADVKYYPIPFFVRGDDVSFALAHQFELLTMNGIASFGDDFALKSGSLPSYLDLRSHLVENLYFLNHTKIKIIKRTARFILSALFSYNYGTANALCQSIEDFMKGPDFLVNNMDMKSRFELNKEWSKNEKMAPVSRTNKNLCFKDDSESKLRYLIRLLTLNGNILPDFLMIKDKAIFQPKGFRASFRQVFRYKKIHYEYTPSMQGYIAEQNKKEFYKCLIKYVKLILTLYKDFDLIKSRYDKELPHLMTRDFWDSVYDKQ